MENFEIVEYSSRRHYYYGPGDLEYQLKMLARSIRSFDPYWYICEKTKSLIELAYISGEY